MQHPKGFTIVEIIIAAIIVGMIAAGGYLWWQGKDTDQNTSANSDQSSSQSQSTPTPTPDPYEGWLTYTNEEAKYSFKYPDTLSVEESTITSTIPSIAVKKKGGQLDLLKIDVDAPMGCSYPEEEAAEVERHIAAQPDQRIHVGSTEKMLKYGCFGYAFPVTTSTVSGGGPNDMEYRMTMQLAFFEAEEKDTMHQLMASMQGITPEDW